jgi:hypothetical protein
MEVVQSIYISYTLVLLLLCQYLLFDKHRIPIGLGAR